MEPEYVYKKGEGWVPVPQSEKWCIVFKSGSLTGKWRNASRSGFCYDSWGKALAQYNKDIVNFKYDMDVHGWQFKIIPYTEGCDV